MSFSKEVTSKFKVDGVECLCERAKVPYVHKRGFIKFEKLVWNYLAKNEEHFVPISTQGIVLLQLCSKVLIPET